MSMQFEEAISTIPPGRYRHFKGNEYEVIGIARHSETEEPMVVYKALYGEGGIWCRPADMWNEQITRNGITYRRFYRLDRIERVEKYERLFDEAAASPDPEKLRLLDAYYTSGEWREDYEADENGELPPDLKRGVLSQDALYDLLESVKEDSEAYGVTIRYSDIHDVAAGFHERDVCVGADVESPKDLLSEDGLN